jgi:hypothetical protein
MAQPLSDEVVAAPAGSQLVKNTRAWSLYHNGATSRTYLVMAAGPGRARLVTYAGRTVPPCCR